jgi:RNA polymerase sigma-70 factor (ECF subfamily)
VAEPPESKAPGGQVEAVFAGELGERLLATLDRLDDEKRAAFVLYEIEELPLREVAEVLGCPLQTAYSRLQAARSFVRADFSERPS